MDFVSFTIGLRYDRSEFIDIGFGDDDSRAHGRDRCAPQRKRRLIIG